MTYAPVILFAYNRPEFVKQTLKSLSENILAGETDLFIYCDGPKINASTIDLDKINLVRNAIRAETWCKTVTIIESETNKGLACSVIDGVTEITKKFGKVIVVEDDVLLSRYFLSYMNNALETYKDDEKVLSIGSWSYFAPSNKFTADTYFFRFPDSIAWATFKRSWNLFEKDAEKLMSQLKSNGMEKEFNAGLKFPYFTNMLEAQINGKVNSWAIRWTATAILNKKLSVFPSISLSKHIGFADDATHEKNSNDYNKDLQLSNREIIVTKKNVEESISALEEWRKFYLKNFIPATNWKTQVRNLIKSLIPVNIVNSYRNIRYKGK